MEIVADKYQIIQFLGSGGFSRVYKGKSPKGKTVAIKLEKKTGHNLVIEDKILRTMKGTEGFPKRHWFGKYNRKNALVMQCLGTSLEQHLKMRKKFSMKTSCTLALQAVDRLEALHNKCYIHRDVKPANLWMGKHDQTLYLIDFGLTKLYQNAASKKHIVWKHRKRFTGSSRYASLATHNGIEQSRRDDLESLYYVIVYLLTGSLPWFGLRWKTKFEKLQAVRQLKEEYNPSKLCSKIPTEIAQIGDHIAQLKFKKAPDYVYLRSLLQKIAKYSKFKLDDVLDWNVQKRPKSALKFVNSARKKQKRNQSNRIQLIKKTTKLQEYIQNNGFKNLIPPKNSRRASQSYRRPKMFRSSCEAYQTTSPHNSSDEQLPDELTTINEDVPKVSSVMQHVTQASKSGYDNQDSDSSEDELCDSFMKEKAVLPMLTEQIKRRPYSLRPTTTFHGIRSRKIY